ncbi:MAG TPA: toprim domain-containing protein [Candidatus Egerieousia sp.]|nr:toprim domain-containing protein [Candidatus Egerieousia sp.]HPT05404.1 toprim domain-containing protein [Candidatus Egerieousia sp.]
MNKGYSENDFETLDWYEHIRRRPGMYLGKLGNGSEQDDGIYVLFKEIVDNAVDEFHEGWGKIIDITLNEETKEVSVRDYGRGIPFGKLLDAVGKMNTGSKFGKDGSLAYGKSVGLNGVGTKAVNATSTQFYVQSFIDGDSYYAYFEEGILIRKGKEKTKDEKDGTFVRYTADDTLYEGYKYNVEFIDTMLKNYVYLNIGLTINFNGNKYKSENGLLDLINDNLSETPLYAPIHLTGKDIEVVITHCTETGENIYSFVNGQNTFNGGTHLSAFREGVGKTIKEFFKKDFDPKDVREGMVAAIYIRVGNPDFANQTKTMLNSKLTDTVANGGIPIRDFIMNFLAFDLDNYLHKNPLTADPLLKKILASEKERKELASFQKARRSKRTSLNNEKLKDCSVHYGDNNERAEETTIFITEGNSASGTITKTRDTKTQAVFSLRGKPKNTFGNSKKVIYDKKNAELNLLQAALGIEEDIDNLRYNKVVIATDADVDGMHIRMLLLTFFLLFYPELVRRGHVYILQTPLFRVRKRKKDGAMDTRYCYSAAEKQDAISKVGKDPEVTRFKGLGEISANEFKDFIGEGMRLDRVRLNKDDSVHEMLEFYMGNNTPDRQNFIKDHLREDVIMEDIISTGTETEK